MSGVSENIKETAEKLLEALNYKIEPSDKALLGLVCGNVETYVKNACNISEIPEKLIPLCSRRVAGEFLQSKMSVGQLEIGELDLSAPIVQLTEGDTSVHFSNGSSEVDRFNALIARLLNDGGELVCFRKIKW